MKDKATAAVAQVESCLYLDEAVKPNYTAAIEQTTSRLEALPYDPVYLLEKEFSYIETGIDEGALTAPTAVSDACAEIFNLETYVENYALLTEALPKWEDTQRKITEISRGLSDGSGIATAETVTLNKLKALVEQSNAVVTDLASYHSFETVAQKALLDNMRQLGAEVDTFLYATFAENAMEDAQQQEQLETTAEQVTRVSKRLVAGYIALGIAVLPHNTRCGSKENTNTDPHYRPIAIQTDPHIFRSFKIRKPVAAAGLCPML